MMKIKNLHFSTKIVLISTVGMIMFVAAFIALDRYYAQAIIIKSERQKVSEINHLLGQMVRGSLELELYESARETYIQTMQRDKNILKITLKDTDITLIELGDETREDQPIIDSNIIIAEKSQPTHIQIIHYTTRHLHENLVSHNTVNLILLFFAFFSILFMYFLINHMMNPLKSIIENIRRFNPNRPEITIKDTKSHDELGVLQNTIHKMMNKVTESHQNIQDLNLNLENKVISRTQQLDDTRQRLEENLQELSASYEELKMTQKQLIESEKMASLGNLVAGVAHEINTPIGVSVTAASMLHHLIEDLTGKYHADTLSEQEFEEHLETLLEGGEMVLRNLRQASHLIDSFKLVSVDQTIDEARSINLCEYIDEVIVSLRPKYRKKVDSIDLSCETPIETTTYPGALAQILTNLILNSIIHGFEEMKKGEIHITATQKKEMILLRYQDNGKGVPAEIQKKIFEPFFTTKKHSGGTGLGLHIVYNLVTHKLGGNISIEKDQIQGTTFYIQFPLHLH